MHNGRMDKKHFVRITDFLDCRFVAMYFEVSQWICLGNCSTWWTTVCGPDDRKIVFVFGGHLYGTSQEQFCCGSCYCSLYFKRPLAFFSLATETDDNKTNESKEVISILFSFSYMRTIFLNSEWRHLKALKLFNYHIFDAFFN